MDRRSFFSILGTAATLGLGGAAKQHASGGAERREGSNSPGQDNYAIFASEFGTVGDGAADDTEALQAAIDTARGLGAPVMIPAGRFAVSTLYVGGVTIVGSGMQATIIAKREGPHPLIHTNGGNVRLQDLHACNTRSKAPVVHVANDQEPQRNLHFVGCCFTNNCGNAAVVALGYDVDNVTFDYCRFIGRYGATERKHTLLNIFTGSVGAQDESFM